MKYLKAPKGQIVKSRAQYCSLNVKIAFIFRGLRLLGPLIIDPTAGIAPDPHIGWRYRVRHDSGL